MPAFFLPDPPRVVSKICGITNAGDAAIAVASGAAAIGINAFPLSKRFADPAASASWLRELEGVVTRIVVVVNPSPDELDSLRDLGVFDAIQFHGDESPEFCAASGFSCWIKAVRVRGPGDLGPALSYPTPWLLLDGWSAGQYGGTGTRVDWDLARDFVVTNPDRHVILAGGLSPVNVRTAVRIVRPYAVDVAGGVETAPGQKEEYLVREFIREAELAP